MSLVCKLKIFINRNWNNIVAGKEDVRQTFNNSDDKNIDDLKIENSHLTSKIMFLKKQHKGIQGNKSELNGRKE